MSAEFHLTRGERLLLQELRDHGPMSPADVRECGFSMSRGPKICDLKVAGLVAETGKRGTESLRYEINDRGRRALDEWRAS